MKNEENLNDNIGGHAGSVAIIDDAATLKAIANPARMRVLGLLRVEGKKTVGQIAQETGMAPGSVSYHLTQLKKAGLAEPVPEAGDNRKSWWRALHSAMTMLPLEERGGEREIAQDVFLQSVSETYAQTYRRYLAEAEALPTEWRNAASNQDYVLHLNVEQMEAMNRELAKVAQKWNLISEQAQRDGGPTSETAESNGTTDAKNAELDAAVEDSARTRPVILIMQSFPYMS